MRKKILILHTLFTLGFLNLLQALDSSVEFRAGYFYSPDSRFRDIYSGAGLYSIETNIQIPKDLLFWVNLGFLYTSGNSIGENDKTKLYAFPLNLGVKFPFRWNGICPYLGLGLASVPFSRIHNNSPFVSRCQYGWGIGGIIKSGLMLHIKECMAFDCFFDYTLLAMNFDHTNKKVVIKRHRKNLNGISAGLGIGFLF